MAQMSTAGKVALAGGAAVVVFLIARAAKAKSGEQKAITPPPGPVVPPQPPPDPTPPKTRPDGDPAPFGHACFPPAYGGSNRYDTTYWEAGGTAVARARIFDAFEGLGYSTPADRDTMNELGPDAELGGGDDVPNPEVTKFQRDYNTVSRWNQFVPKAQMGGLDQDGKVGPCTLNALKLVHDNLGDADWQNDIVQRARDAGA